MNCPSHPRYKAKRAPKNACNTCLEIWWMVCHSEWLKLHNRAEAARAKSVAAAKKLPWTARFLTGKPDLTLVKTVTEASK